MKTTPDSMKWTERWAILYGYPPAKREVELLQDWLNERFPDGWSAEELHDALEEYSEEERKDGNPRPRPPTGPQIRTIIKRIRYRKAVEREGSGAREIRWIHPDTRKIFDVNMKWIRDSLANEESSEKRFEIICGVLGPGETDVLIRELISYAQNLPGGVDIYRPEPGSFYTGRRAVQSAFSIKEKGIAPAPAKTAPGYKPGSIDDQENAWL